MSPEDSPIVQQTRPERSRVVAIMGGRGGVGKSSIAVNVGIVLAKNAARVCIVDADSGHNDTSYMLGLAPEFTLEHVLFSSKSVEETLLHGPYGMKILSGAQALSQGKSLQWAQQLRLRRELERLENDVDWLLLDTPHGVSETCLDIIGAASRILVVITPDPTTLSAAFTQIKFLHQLRGVSGFHVVVNMCLNGEQAKEIFYRFSSTVEKYIGIKVRFMGHLLRDESVRLGSSMQNPVALFPEHDPSIRGFLRLAEALDRLAPEIQPTGFSRYWFSRFTGASALASVAAAGHSKPSLSAPDILADLKARWLNVMECCEEEKALGLLLEEMIGLFAARFGEVAATQVRQYQQMVARRLENNAQAPSPATVGIGETAMRASTPAQGDRSGPLPALAAQRAGDAPGPPHGYLAEKFGSQQGLLAKLRSSSAAGKSTLELLDLL